MVSLARLFCVLAACAIHAAAQACTTIQYAFPPGAGANTTRAAAVMSEYISVWGEYQKYAFGNDSLLPLAQSAKNDLFGWGATIVDGIDTAVVMGLTDVVSMQLEWIAGMDFSYSESIVDEFDAMIRYIGGLLSAYDLINSDLVPNGTYNQAHVNSLLQAAVTISDKLKPMFNTPFGLPLANINFTSGAYSNCDPIKPCKNATSVDTAICGTIILEWYRLSDLTGDASYRTLAERVEEVLISPNQTLLHPNLVGSSLDYKTGEYTNFAVGWQAGIDSFYEYLIKTYSEFTKFLQESVMSGLNSGEPVSGCSASTDSSRFPEFTDTRWSVNPSFPVYSPTQSGTSTYMDFWVGAVDSTIQYLAKHPFGFPELTFISQADHKGVLQYTMDDYACFAGGNYLLGGKYLNNKQFIDLGLAVTDSCHQTFNTTESGLNPIEFSWFNERNKTYETSVENDPAQVAYFQRAGYFVDDPFWGALPEPIESMFYAYRITGNPIWQQYAWEAFEAILNDTQRRPGETFADLSNVTQAHGGRLQNYVPSFYFAEVLKYLYLIFSEPSLVSLDEYVFNTECHPFKIQGGTCATQK